MFFGKKEKKGKEARAGNAQPEFQIETMPDVFYGGKNPEVYEHPQSGASAPAAGASIPKKNVPKKPLAPPKRPTPAPPRAGIFGNRRLVIIVSSILFVLAVGGISWYYIREANQTIPRGPGTQAPTTPATSVDIPIADVSEVPDVELSRETTTTEDGLATSTFEDTVPTTTPALADQPIIFPSTFLVDSPDIDNDDLTDLEEELFGTDSGNSDTDSDGYYDGLEVFNLYNPRGQAPIRLIDSGLVREYTHPLFQYRLYYPASWEVAAVDPAAKQVLISAASGDYIEIRAIDRQAGDSFVNWFAAFAPGQRFTDLDQFENRFEEEGYRREDGLVAYFAVNRIVYAVVYHPGVTGMVPYRSVMRMVMQSFRPNQTFVDLPDQNPLPPAPSATATPQ